MSDPKPLTAEEIGNMERSAAAMPGSNMSNFVRLLADWRRQRAALEMVLAASDENDDMKALNALDEAAMAARAALGRPLA